MRWWMILLLGTGGCLNASNVQEKMVKASCEFSANCSTASFNAYYDNVKDCVDGSAGYIDADYYAECKLDKKKANSCIAALKAATRSCEYEEVYEAYDDCGYMWDCN